MCALTRTVWAQKAIISFAFTYLELARHRLSGSDAPLSHCNYYESLKILLIRYELCYLFLNECFNLNFLQQLHCYYTYHYNLIMQVVINSR